MWAHPLAEVSSVHFLSCRFLQMGRWQVEIAEKNDIVIVHKHNERGAYAADCDM